jgi:hypothetical protein
LTKQFKYYTLVIDRPAFAGKALSKNISSLGKYNGASQIDPKIDYS